MKNNLENKINVIKSANKVIASSVIIITIIVVLFSCVAMKLSLTLSDASSLSTVLGGIISPIIGISGSILVFFALHEQVKANGLVQEQIIQQNKDKALQNESDEIHQLYNNLKDSIDNFSYYTLDTYQFGHGQYVNGSEAIYKLFHDFYCDCHINESDITGNPKITELISILEICSIILQKLSKSSIPDKYVLRTLTKHQFRYRVYPKLNSELENLSKHYCNSCEKDHGLPDNMVDLIKRLESWTEEEGI
jgi:hypothetical protein